MTAYGSTQIDPALIARAHRATEYLHAMVYFAPEAEAELTAVGLRPGRMTYFASRSAPMGAVGAATVAATFYNFNPEIVARHIPRAWTLATPEDVVAARQRAAEAALTRLLGEAAASTEVDELAELTREATTALTLEGRPLYAGHASLAWPSSTVGVLWHAAALLREYRGDGHLMALQRAGLDGVEAGITHVATGRGFTEDAHKLTRGWSDEQWAAGVGRLQARGLLDDSGLTDAGKALRAQVERETDELDTAAWNHLGEQATLRLVELGKPLSRRVVDAGGMGPVRAD